MTTTARDVRAIRDWVSEVAGDSLDPDPDTGGYRVDPSDGRAKVDVLYERGGVTLLILRSYAAARLYGHDTAWSTSFRRNLFQQYALETDLHVLLDETRRQKYQFAVLDGRVEAYDADDSPVPFRRLASTYPFLRRLFREYL